MAEIHDRLKEVRRQLKLSQAKIAKLLGFAEKAYPQYESGVRALTERHITLMYNVFHVNKEWLLTGRGEMFEDRTVRLKRVLRDDWELSEEEVTWVSNFIGASRDQRRTFYAGLALMQAWRL